ncbi:putative LOC729966 homolog isoform 2-T2 [Vipera latastei]
MEPANMALQVLFLLVAFIQDSLSASNNASTPSLPVASTTVTLITAALTVSDTTQSRADVTSKAASSSMPQSTEATSSATKTNYSTSNGLTMTFPTGSKEHLTSQMAGSINGTTQAGQLSPEPAFSTKPGLVVVICLFVFVLVIGTFVLLIKCCRPKEPAFKKLDEVPMRKVAEDSPFARYPPK